MQQITSIDDLKKAIELLEVEQKQKGRVLNEQFFLTYEKFKPVNLITSTITDIAKSPFLIDNIMGTAMGLATGFLSKKLFIAGSGNQLRKLIGIVLQFGVTNVVAQNSETIKSFGRSLFRNFIHKKEMNTAKP
jgi:hypothetical protein